MNAVDRAALDAVPVPRDAAGELAICCAIRVGGEWRTAWLIGTRKEPFGPAYPSVKAVAAASRHINEHHDR